MLLTSICIIAVDFPLFPRSHAKTERFGISLMDMGVGMFIVTGGLTSSEVKNTFTLLNASKVRKRYPLIQLGITIALGIMRPVLLEMLHYPVHESEYGKHWNFFDTLVVCWVGAALVTRIRLATEDWGCRIVSYLLSGRVVDAKSYWFVVYTSLIALSCLSCYQWVLLQPVPWCSAAPSPQPALTEYLLLSNNASYPNGICDGLKDRDPNSFVSSNREGIASCAGYLALYLLAQVLSVGIYKTNASSLLLLTFLLSVAGVTGLTWIVLDSAVQTTSRRLCNAAYVCCVLFASSLSLLELHVAEWCFSQWRSTSLSIPKIIKISSDKQLFVFLWANVCTGLINLSIQTMYIDSPIVVLGILLLYLVCVYVPWLWL